MFKPTNHNNSFQSLAWTQGDGKQVQIFSAYDSFSRNGYNITSLENDQTPTLDSVNKNQELNGNLHLDQCRQGSFGNLNTCNSNIYLKENLNNKVVPGKKKRHSAER